MNTLLYSEHIMDKLDTVIEHWEHEEKLANDTVNLYLRIRKLTLAYADGIEKQLTTMASAKFETAPNSPITALRDYAAAVTKVHREFADNLLSDIVKPLQATLQQQAGSMREAFAKGKKHCKKLQIYRSKQIKAEKLIVPQSEPAIRRSNSERQAFARQKNYNDSVASLNQFLEENSDEIKQVMDTLQKCEVDRLKTVQTTLLAFAEQTQQQGSWLTENAQLLAEVKSKQKVSGFDIDKCIRDFVAQHLDKHSYSRSKTLQFNGQILELMDSEFSIVNLVLQKCWEGRIMTESERRDFRDALKSVKGRADCLSWMNQHRAKGAYELVGLDMTGELLMILLDEAHLASDIVNASLCIVLSQTFYDASHTFLQTRIAKHRIWQDVIFWDSAFALKVQNDMDQFNQYCLTEEDPESERQEKLRSVLLSQFTTFMTIMKSFEIEDNDIKQFMDRQKLKFSLSSSDEETLMTVLDCCM